jgi:hypothetical protein
MRRQLISKLIVKLLAIYLAQKNDILPDVENMPKGFHFSQWFLEFADWR